MERPDFDLSDADAAAFCPSCGAGYTSQARECIDCTVALWSRSQIEEELNRQAKAEETSIEARQQPEFDLSDPDAVSFCPVCGASFNAVALRCVDCDEDLVPRSWVELRDQQQAPDPWDETVLLRKMAGPIEAGRLELELAEAGIRFYSQPHGVVGLGHGGLQGTVNFFVLGEDLDRANGILNRLKELGERPPDFPLETEPDEL